MMIMIVPAIFHLVLTASWQSSFVILLVLLVRPLMGPRVPARWRYLLWSLVVLRLLVPVATFPSSPVSIQNLAVVNHPLAETPATAAPLHELQSPAGLPGAPFERGGANFPVSSSRVQPPSLSWWSAVAAVWITGTCTVLAVMITAQVLLRRRLDRENPSINSSILAVWYESRRRLGIKGGPTLRLTAQVDSPALVGVLRPVLLLPEAGCAVYSSEDWENVFLHELAHYRRGDHWTHVLHLAALAVHWFNPLVWVALRQLRADRELAADEWALQHLDPERSVGYGDTLLKVLAESSGRNLTAASLGILEDRMQLKHRLQRIVDFGPHKLFGSLIGFALLATLGAVTLTGSIIAKSALSPVALKPQDVLMQSIVQNDRSMAENALKSGAQIDSETEYLHDGYVDRNTPLYFAAEKGELDLVKLFIAHGASVKPGRSTWTNPLDAALRNGHADVAAYLHDHGATTDALVYAAGVGDVGALTKLLAAGATKSLEEAARAAAGCGQAQALATLLGKGANPNQAFQRAATTGNVASMQYLATHGVNVLSVGYEALGHAAANDRTEAVSLLLKAGVSPNRQKQPGDTRFTVIDPPLNQAARAGAIGSVKLLLAAGADPNSILITDPGYGDAGNTPLCDACEQDNADIAGLLLDHGAKLEMATSHGFTPALYAAYVHAPRCLALFLDRGANRNAWNPKWKCGLLRFADLFTGEDANRPDLEKETASRLNQCMATVQVLLDHGFNVNTPDHDGISLLSSSIVNGQSALTEMLLKDGADVNAVGQNGMTPLMSALMSRGQVTDARYLAVLNELLARGADPNLGTDGPIAGEGTIPPSPLKMAICWFGTAEAKQKTVALLLAHGASFSVPKGSDAEQMLLAATNGDTERVAQLLAKGVSPNVVDSKGWTPLLSAAAMEHDAILKMLVAAGANVKAQDVIGLNPLWFAMERYPDLTNAHLLLEKGADVNADSNFVFYNPVLYTAIEQHDPALLADLLKHGASPNLLPGIHPNRFEPLELAVDQLMEKFDDPKRREVVTTLIAAGANRNPKQEGYRVSLLYFPVENNRIDMVKFLLNAGVDPKKDMDGGKALSDTLERHGSKEMKALVEPVLGKT